MDGWVLQAFSSMLSIPALLFHKAHRSGGVAGKSSSRSEPVRPEVGTGTAVTLLSYLPQYSEPALFITLQYSPTAIWELQQH